MWFEEHVPLDFNFHTAQVHLNEFLTRLRRDQKLFEEIDDINPNYDKGPLTEQELFLARKTKKEKELLKEIDQIEDTNVKRKISNPSHSDSEEFSNNDDQDHEIDNISLREFPYPYRAALTISSDIDATESLEEFLTMVENIK